MKHVVVTTLLVALLSVPAGAAFTPISSVTTSDSVITLPEDPSKTGDSYLLTSVTVGSYTESNLAASDGTMVAGQLNADGTFVDWSGDTANDSADNLDICDLVARNHKMSQSPTTDVIFTSLGGMALYGDQNGAANPDFFLFEAAYNEYSDTIKVRAIFADDSVGMWSADLGPALWGLTGKNAVGQLKNNGQAIVGIAFSITDLLDANGANLASTAQIKGIEIDSLGVDPSALAAAVPEPATMSILALGGLMALRRRK